MPKPVISELNIYPIKGCQGISVDSIFVDESGVRGDRDFSFWADGKLVDQKCTPLLASITASVDRDGTTLTLRHSAKGIFEHKIRRDGDKLDTAHVLDKYKVIDQGNNVAAWASAIVGKALRLVTPGDAWTINLPIESLSAMHGREKKKFFAVSSVSFTNTASLVDFNEKIDTPVSMDRFRSNIVLSGIEAWEEDKIERLCTDEVQLQNLTGSERCVIITTDQKTGERPKNNILQMLKKHRLRSRQERFASGLLFGNYVAVKKAGVLRVGETLVKQLGEKQGPACISDIGEAQHSNAELNKLLGTWALKVIDTPIGDQAFNVVFNLVDGQVSGLVSGPAFDEANIEDCILEGNTLTFVVELIEPIELPLSFNLQLAGDQITGAVKLGALGGASVTGVKSRSV